MKKRNKILLTGAIIVVVVVIIIMNLSMGTGNAVPVKADVAEKRDLIEIVTASGRIQPQTKVDITSQINGKIIKLYVHEGDYVNTGDLLVVLDTVQLRSDVDQARFALNEVNARLEGAKAALEQAEEEYDRQKRLYENQLTSETAYSNAKYAYMSAKATYDATKSQAAQLQAQYEKQLDNLNKAKIVAPMPGIITFLDCEEGEIAAAQTAFTQGKKLMTIANLNVFEVEVEVDETEITKVELGQKAKIEVDAFPDTTFMGQVTEIGNTAILSGLGTQDQSTNFKVKVIFDKPNEKIRPGMSATVDITTSRHDGVVAVPYSAVVIRSLDVDSLYRAQKKSATTEEDTDETDEGGVLAAETTGESEDTDIPEKKRKEIKGVFLIREGVARFVPIETGIADQKYIEIVSGLQHGDSVIVGPYRILRTIKDGDEVKVEKKTKKKESH